MVLYEYEQHVYPNDIFLEACTRLCSPLGNDCDYASKKKVVHTNFSFNTWTEAKNWINLQTGSLTFHL